MVRHGEHEVISIIDGQTIGVSHRGRELPVQLLGLRAGALTLTADQLGRDYQAMSFLRDFLTARRVQLRFDPALGPVVRNGRVLAYVWVFDAHPLLGTREVLVNAEMLRLGYATLDPDIAHEYAEYFQQAQAQAPARVGP